MPTRSPVLLLLLAGCAPSGGKDSTPTPTNTAPSSPSIIVSPAFATTDQDLTVVFTAQSSDAEGDAVSYRYLWSVDGTVRADLTTDTVPASETTKGESWTVTVTPSDGTADGTPATANATIVNTPPAAMVSLDPASPGVTDDVTATAEATDADGDAVTFTYAWSVDGTAGSDTDAVLPAGTAVRGETWTVTATPSDGEEAGAPAEASVTFGNTAPSASSVTITPADPTKADTLVATVDGVEDADGDAVTFTYTWSVDGAVVQDGASDSLGPEWFSKSQSVEVTATPNDGLTDGDAVTSAAVVIQNTRPSIDAVTINPAVAYEASTLTCLPSGYVDIDGDLGTYAYSWSVDGSVVASTATINGSLFNKGASIACSVTPNDGEADGATVASSAVTVLNTAPTLGVATLTNRTPAEADTVAVTLTGASDDDGDSIGYAYNWYVDGTLAATTSTIDGAHFAKGDSIQVEVLPWDGSEYGAPVWSDTAVAVNTAPAVAVPTLTPTTAYTNDVLTASNSTSDADGDAVSVTYTWYVNGVPSSATGSTLDGSVHFDKGDEVYVVATPGDGETAGTGTSSATVTILNSPPSSPVVAISPTEPVDGDDLVCDVVTPSTDADGDALTYTYSWEVDGSAAGISSETVPAGDTSVGETWTCSVVADDGDSLRAAASDAVVVTCASGAGATEACPATNCLDVLDQGYSTGDGLYWLDPSGSGAAAQVYCDMSTDGGGWTLVYKRGTASSDTPHACSSSETSGYSTSGLASISVGSSDRVCGSQSLLESSSSELACDWLDSSNAVNTRVVYQLTVDTAWSALTADALGASYSHLAVCAVDGTAGVLDTSGAEALWTCDTGTEVYSVWHTTGCCGGPWTFADAWDYATESNGRCWAR